MAKRRRPASNPLNAQVNSAIIQQSQPYVGGITAANRQFNADQAGINKVDTALQSELGTIGNTLSGRSADLLNLSATRAQQQGQNYQSNMDFLKSVFGPDAQQTIQPGYNLQLAQSNAQNVGDTYGAGFGAGAIQRDLAGMQGSAALRKVEDINSQRAASNERKRALLNEINRIKASRPLLRRQFASENLKDRLLQQEYNLSRKQQGYDRDQQLWERKNAADDRAFKAWEDNLAAQQAGYDNYAQQKADWNKIAISTRGDLVKTDWGDPSDPLHPDPNKRYEYLPAAPLRTFMSALTDKGIDPDIALQYAAKWVGDYKPTWGANSQERIQKAGEIYSLMAQWRVSRAAQKRLIISRYGKKMWKRLTTHKAGEQSSSLLS